MTAGPLLVALDPDHVHTSVLDLAVQLAARLQAPLAILMVLPMSVAEDPDILRNPAAHPAAIRRMEEDQAAVAPRLRELGARARDAGATVSIHVAHGAPAMVIVGLVDTLGAKHVVLGTHGREGLARFAWGGVAEAVSGSTPVPVTTLCLHAPPPRSALIAHHELPLDQDA